MRKSIHIREDYDEQPDYGAHNPVTYMTPAEAEGELVVFEAPGTMGEEVYRIMDVNPEAMETILVNIHTGAEYMATDSILPPAWNRFTTPRPGFTYTVSWKEHMNGRGEWVKVTPEVGRGRYPRFYEGHEATRRVNKTYTYTPPGVKELEIKLYEGEPHVFCNKDTEEIEGLTDVFREIKPDVPEFEVLGHVYVNSDWEIVHYDIKLDYRVDNYTTPVGADYTAAP